MLVHRERREGDSIYTVEAYSLNEDLLKDFGIECMIMIDSSGVSEIHGECGEFPDEIISLMKEEDSDSRIRIVHGDESLYLGIFSIKCPDDERIRIAFGRRTREFKDLEYRKLKHLLSHVCFSKYAWRRVEAMRNYVEKYKELAFHDPLTGAYTRHFFNEWITKHSAYLKRTHKITTFIMVDVDNMKGINDLYGHLKGDEILRGISNILIRASRRMDLVIRYGGDEFLLVLPETNLKDAKRIMERIKKILRLYSKNLNINLTVSYGMAQTSGDDYEDALNFADMKMYEMKKESRGGGNHKSMGLLW